MGGSFMQWIENAIEVMMSLALFLLLLLFTSAMIGIIIFAITALLTPEHTPERVGWAVGI
jgi:phage shock protein PspC (stress-responsive transcriptional regulator)